MRDLQGIVMIMGSWSVGTGRRLPSQMGEQRG